MLTIKQIDSAKPKEKAYRVADSGGLFFFVPPTRKRFGGCGTDSMVEKKRWL